MKNLNDYVTKTWKYRLSGYVGLPFFTLMMLLANFSNQTEASYYFIPFIIISIIIIIFSGTIHFNDKYIMMFTLTGTYRIFWKDIISIESGEHNIVFIGENKRMSIPIFRYWSSSDVSMDFIEILEKNNLDFKETFRSSFLFHRNSRI